MYDVDYVFECNVLDDAKIPSSILSNDSSKISCDTVPNISVQNKFLVSFRCVYVLMCLEQTRTSRFPSWVNKL